MKPSYQLLLTAAVFFFTMQYAHSQFNPVDNTFSALPQDASPSVESTPLHPDTASATCSAQNSFWGFDIPSGELREFDLTNNTITNTGNSISFCPGYSLAICNNLNAGTVSPTFYTSSGSTAWYWDANTTWIQATGSSSGTLYNAGGSGNALYFLDNSGFAEIIKYNGTVFSPFFSINKYSGIADIAVDSAGNIWFLSRGGTSSVSDSLYVISPLGQIINQYPLVITTNFAYGCVMMNGVFYVGYGPNGSANQNCLLPIKISGNAAIIDSLIPLPGGTQLNNDLASCHAGMPLGINIPSGKEEFSIMPNPAQDYFIINCSPAKDASYEIYDLAGKGVFPLQQITTGTTRVDITRLKQSIYIVQIINGSSILRKRFCKM